MSIELEERSQSIELDQKIPEELGFELDYEKFGNPIDFFERYRLEIEKLHAFKDSNLFKREFARIVKIIFDEYFRPSLEAGKPVFINANIQRKECIPSIFRHLITDSLQLMSIQDKEITSDLQNIFTEALENFPRHSDTNDKKNIALKLLIDREQIQLLIGDLNLPKVSDQNSEKLTEVSDPMNMLESGRGLSIIKILSDKLEIRGKAKLDEFGKQEYDQRKKPLFEDMAYLITKKLQFET